MGDKVINFSDGSKYYFEIGTYYYNKNNLDKALLYYQRALAVDPANPVNHFNVACLLSELGKYRESSSIFNRIVTEMDSGMSESWFWLAMNYGQLQQYKEACQYLRKYLEQEPHGDYSWQAEEILEYMRSDLPMLSAGQRNKIDRLCNQGIDLVNQGRLKEAIKCFTKASDIEPELTAPLNNLALSWFYLGKIGKAIEMTKSILEREPNNVFANCNLTTFYYIVNDQLAMRRQVQILDGLWGDDPDEMLKLGTTYGLLGMDRKAFDAFRVLYDTSFRSFELILLLGIAAYNCGHTADAVRFFDRVNELEPDNPYKTYRESCNLSGTRKIPYHLRVPEETVAALLEAEPDEANMAAIADSPDLWGQLLWIIRNGSGVARKRLIEVILRIKPGPLLDALITMAWEAGVDTRCRQDIFSAVAEAGHNVWASRYWNRGFFPEHAELVLKRALEIMAEQGCDYLEMVRAYGAWVNFWTGNKPRIRNIRLWSVALVVFVEGLDAVHDKAGRFGLAPRSLQKAVLQLRGLCP